MPYAIGDLASQLCDVAVAILTADTTIRSLVGRTTRICVPQKDVSSDGLLDLPVIVYHYAGDVEIGGTLDERRAVMVWEVVTDGDDAQTKGYQIVAALRAALTYNAFSARGLEAYVEGDRELATIVTEDREETRGVALTQLRTTIYASAP